MNKLDYNVTQISKDTKFIIVQMNDICTCAQLEQVAKLFEEEGISAVVFNGIGEVITDTELMCGDKFKQAVIEVMEEYNNKRDDLI